MQKNEHHIKKQVLQIQVIGKKKSHNVQAAINRIWEDQLLPRLEVILNQLSKEGYIHALEKVEIDLGKIPIEKLEEELPRIFEKKILVQLSKLLNEEKSATNVPLAKSHFSNWLLFLENGWMPWYAPKVEEKQYLESILNVVSTNFRANEKLQEVLRNKPNALRRLVYQYDEVFFIQLLKAIFGKEGQYLLDVIKEFRTCNQYFEKSKWFQEVFVKSKWDEAASKNKFWIQVFKANLLAFKKVEKMVFIKNFFQYSAKNVEDVDLILHDFISHIKSDKTKYPVISEMIPQLKRSFKLKSIGQRRSPTIMIDPVFGKNERNTLKQTEALLKTKSSVANNEKQLKLNDSSIEKYRKRYFQESEETERSKFENFTLLSSNTSEEGIYLSNAGMVILHPFLTAFFENTNLLENKKFRTITDQFYAAHLINYVVTKKEQMEEFDMILSKFLCGIDLEEPIDRAIQLKSEHKEEGEELLKSVISHWQRLGSCSPDALREGFFFREGKLKKSEGGWKLHVERKSIDILMDDLPWNLSLIKLPWIEGLLYVDWS